MELVFTGEKEPLGPSPSGNIGNVSGGKKGAELISMLKRRRALTSNWMEEIISHENLTRAYRQVIGNGGNSGVDGMETEELKDWLRGNLPELSMKLLSGEYEPKEVCQVEIPKSNGGTQLLGIPIGNRPADSAGDSPEAQSAVRGAVFGEQLWIPTVKKCMSGDKPSQ